MKNYSIKKGSNHEMVLIKGNMETFCPYQSPMIVPAQTSFGNNGFNLIRFPCSTQCPFATVNFTDGDDQKKGVYTTDCNGKKEFEFDENEQTKLPSEKSSILTSV